MTQKLNVSFEIKAVSGRKIEGHGSVFRNRDLGGDIVVPGAFNKSLKQHQAEGSMPLMFWMHNPSEVPGVWTAMEEDSKGLAVEGELVDTQLGNEVKTLLQKKAVRGLSIGYRTLDSEYDKDGNLLLKEVDLWEVSIVSLAMNPLAQVEAMKSRLSRDGEYVPSETEMDILQSASRLMSERQFEKLLRDSGCSRKVAATFVAKHYDPSDASSKLEDRLRDAGEVDEAEAAELLKLLTQENDRVWASIFAASR